MSNFSSKIIKNSNFYNFSFSLICSHLFYKDFFKKKNQQFSKHSVFKFLKFESTGQWNTKNTYFSWDLLRTIFYFQFYFRQNPKIKFYRKYYNLTVKLTMQQSEFYLIANFLYYYRKRFPKLSTRNYVNVLNNYEFAIRESQNITRLPFNTIFDFYNWKTKIPVKFIAAINRNEQREFYVYFYRQLFAYKNLK